MRRGKYLINVCVILHFTLGVFAGQFHYSINWAQSQNITVSASEILSYICYDCSLPMVKADSMRSLKFSARIHIDGIS